MNSIRVSDSLKRAWLEVRVVKVDDSNLELHSHIFDGTPFTIRMPSCSDKIEVNPSNSSIGLLEVGRVGEGSGYIEVVLPAPALNFGHTVRVLSTQLAVPAPVAVPTKYKRG